jgi:hypothetical protein
MAEDPDSQKSYQMEGFNCPFKLDEVLARLY